MARTSISSILLLASIMLLWSADAGRASPMGTAFTYQGRLLDVNEPANGLYDFQFKLFDSPGPIGRLPLGTIDINEVDVIEGHFAVRVDFGAEVFDGDARWLQIGVRAGELEDPNGYTFLWPRQEMTPTPYALFARNGGGAGDRHSLDAADGDPVDVVYVDNEGNVGIGTTTRRQNLTVEGPIQGSISSLCGAAVYGRNGYTGSALCIPPNVTCGGWFEAADGIGVFGRATGATSNAVMGRAEGSQGSAVFGLASASSGTNFAVYGKTNSIAGYAGYFEGGRNYFQGNVGIGTNTPAVNLDVAGNIRAVTEAGSAVQGYATSTGWVWNYGGHFASSGGHGIGVSGEGTNKGNVTNFGGFFKALGNDGRGVYAEATGATGVGVNGVASATGEVKNYGGAFMAAGDDGIAVHGKATAIGSAPNGGGTCNYGGYFESLGVRGIGVRAESKWIGVSATGGSVAVSANGSLAGVSASSGWTDGRGVKAIATGGNGVAVEGEGQAYDFYASGPGINYGQPSSIRWKSDVRPIDDPLGKVLRLRGVYFNWDAEHGGEPDVGMIGEEVGQVLPEVVAYEEDGKYTSGMDYSKLTPLLVEAVKALKEQADERERDLLEKDARIAQLEKRITELATRLEQVETTAARLGIKGVQQ